MTPPTSDPTRFPANSRYRDVDTATTTLKDGREVRYLLRRFVPDPATFAPRGQVTVAEGDRLDTIAASAIGDAELWWQIADANRALDPRDLLDPLGQRLVVPLPLGIPGGFTGV